MSGLDVQVIWIRLAGELEGDRAVRLGMQELVDGRVLRVEHFFYGALRSYYAVMDPPRFVPFSSQSNTGRTLARACSQCAAGLSAFNMV